MTNRRFCTKIEYFPGPDLKNRLLFNHLRKASFGRAVHHPLQQRCRKYRGNANVASACVGLNFDSGGKDERQSPE